MTVTDQGSPEVLHEEGRTRLARGQVERACEAFCRVLEGCPEALDDVAAAFGTASVRRQAVAALKSGNGSDTARACRYALAARLARDLGCLEEALSGAESAAQTDPQCASWWFALGEARRIDGDRAGAAAAYKRCVAVDPNHPTVRVRLAACRRRRRGSWLAGALARSRLVHRVLSRSVWAGGRATILEERGDSARVHQMRWARALEHGGALPIFWKTPEGEEPENFAEHWKTCFCPIWRWFLECGIESEVRTVLDVGCGTGSLSEHFLRQGFDVSGVTVNPSEKTECLRRGIKIIEEDFHFLSVSDGNFDLVLSSHSLEHSIAPVFALMEWKRVVRPGGYMMIALPLGVERDMRAVFPDYYDPEEDAIRFPVTGGDVFARQESYGAVCTYGGGPHVYVLSYWQLRWLFRLVGMELVAEGLEMPGSVDLFGIEHVDGRLPRDQSRPFSGLFLLRKPASK